MSHVLKLQMFSITLVKSYAHKAHSSTCSHPRTVRQFNPIKFLKLNLDAPSSPYILRETFIQPWKSVQGSCW